MVSVPLALQSGDVVGEKNFFLLDYGIKWEYIIEDECVRSQCVALSTSEYVKEGVEAVALWFLPRSSELNKEKDMVVSDETMTTLCNAITSITEALDRNNSTLEKILGHYNSVVPPMQENADRSNRIGREAEIQNGGGYIEN